MLFGLCLWTFFKVIVQSKRRPSWEAWLVASVRTLTPLCRRGKLQLPRLPWLFLEDHHNSILVILSERWMWCLWTLIESNPDLISVPRSVSLCYVVSNFPNQVFVVILHSLITEMPEARLRHSKVGLDSLKFPSVICRSLKGIIRTGWNCWRLYERGRISVNFNAIDIFIHFFRNWGFQSKTTTDFPGK